MAVGPQLTTVLRQYGLESLTEWASQALINGLSEEQIVLDLYERPEFRTRFAGIFKREAAGLPPLSIDQYLQYESMASALSSTWGMKLSKDEVDNLIANDVSVQELEQRFTIAASAVFESPQETRDELSRLFNIGQGDLMRYWMNPKAQLGVLEQQYRMGEIAGAALWSGFGQINRTQAQRLQESGLTRETALTGFGQVSQMAELFSPLDFGEDAITADEQIELLAGNADVASEVETRARRRRGTFQGEGGFATGEEGFATGSAS